MARILCPTIVGRDGELAELGAAIDRAQQGSGAVLFVTGAAGIGKSRLLQEAGAQARRRAATVLTGRCVPSTVPVPYRPLGEALLEATDAIGTVRSTELAGFGAALGWIVPAWRDPRAPGAPESPIVVAEALRRALRTVARSTGCVLLVEDLQWADPETLHAIEYLTDHVGDSRVLLICSLRDEASAPAVLALRRLEARRAADVMRLGPLSRDGVMEMASRSLEAPLVDGAIARLLEDSAEGLPFLVEEILATAATSGALVRRGAAWELSHAVPRIVPESFAVSVRERMHALGPDGRRMLGAAALLGRSFDWRAAAQAAPCGSDTAHTVLELGVALQLLAADEDSFSFRHALTREAILAELLPHERAELAARCLQVVEAMPSLAGRQLAADLAEAAGMPEHAAALLLGAGSAALDRGAVETACALLQRAQTLSTDRRRRADVQEALADAASAAGDLARTRDAVASLLANLAAIDAPRPRRAQAHLLLARCAVTVTHFDTAAQELQRARTLTGDDRALAARVAAVAAQLAVGEARPADAEALAREAAVDAEATDQPGVICEALEVASRCARTRDLEEALAIGRRALQVADAAGLAYWRMRALYQVGVVEMFRGYSVDTLRRARDEAERLGAVATATSLDVEIAAALEARFQHREARETCARCIETAQVLDLHGVHAIALLFLAITEAVAGSRRRMENAIGRALAIGGDDVELNGAAWGDARAVASLAAEDRVRARGELAQALEIYRRSAATVLPRLGAALCTVLDALGGREPDFASASGVTLQLTQGAGYVAFAEAVLHGRSGDGARALAAVERGERHLAVTPWYLNLMRRLVAEAAISDGWGEPVTWLTEAAAFFDGAGNDRLASASRALLRRAGVRVSRPTRAAKALPAPLRDARVTAREAEVLALVAEGLSNREIGERLFLSERTVEQHVSWLKRKLGVRTRAQLAVRGAVESASGG